jgi:hypothetical protein
MLDIDSISSAGSNFAVGGRKEHDNIIIMIIVLIVFGVIGYIIYKMWNDFSYKKIDGNEKCNGCDQITSSSSWSDIFKTLCPTKTTNSFCSTPLFNTTDGANILKSMVTETNANSVIDILCKGLEGKVPRCAVSSFNSVHTQPVKTETTTPQYKPTRENKEKRKSMLKTVSF